MDQQEWLAEQFEVYRLHLRKVAYRMLGSTSEADDALQESWLRISRAGAGGVENMGGWLTTIVGRVCLDMLRARKARREDPLEAVEPENAAVESNGLEEEVLLSDSVGLALLVILATLTPAERVAYVLHDMFGQPFEKIGSIVGRSAAAARQLASRARRRVRGVAAVPDRDRTRQREMVEAFLAASRSGDFDALVAILDPDVVIRGAGEPGAAAAELRGASVVARGALAFSRRAESTRILLVDGDIGLAWFGDGQPLVVLTFRCRNSKIVDIEIIADIQRIRTLNLADLAEKPDGRQANGRGFPRHVTKAGTRAST